MELAAVRLAQVRLAARAFVTATSPSMVNMPRALLVLVAPLLSMASELPTVGFIGLGTMGGGMAVHLHERSMREHGKTALVYNRSPVKAQAHATAHGTVAVDTFDGLSGCDVLVLCLSTSADVESVLSHVPIKQNALVIDCTSGEPEVSRRLHASLRDRCAARFVDAPVSGGPKGAAAGSLTSMLGGDEADCAAAMQWIEAWSSKVVRCGPSGAGDAVKAVNNVLNSAHVLLATEGMLALNSFGVEPSVALDVINSASGRSLQTERLPDNILSRKFAYGFALELMRKDCGIAATLVNQETPDATLIPEVYRLLQAAEAELGGKVDYTEVARFLERRGGKGLELRAAA